MLGRNVFASLVAIAGILGAQFSMPDVTRATANGTKFTVRIENISSSDGQTASDGTRWPFALSPGMWVIHDQEVLFKEGKPAINGLEAQAEDGTPAELIKSLETHHSDMLHAIFNRSGRGIYPRRPLVYRFPLVSLN